MVILSNFYIKLVGLEKILRGIFMSCYYIHYQMFKKTLDIVQYTFKCDKLIF